MRRHVRPTPIVVEDFGAVRLADAQTVALVAETIVAERRRGSAVVAVLPPYRDVTEELLRLAHAVSADPQPRELDLLVSTGASMSTALCAMAVQRLGFGAVSLEATQAGIVTDGAHSQARVIAIRTARVLEEARNRGCVLIAGTLGVAEATGEVTSLASTTSEVAIRLARALRATRCDVVSSLSPPPVEPQLGDAADDAPSAA